MNKQGVAYDDPKNMTLVQGMSVASSPEADLGKSLPQGIPTLEKQAKSGNMSGAKFFAIFNNFSLIQVEESKDQIAKLHQNFGANWSLFFFGESPSMYTFSGVFIDSWNYPYYQEFMVMYDVALSGRKCVENKYKMKIIYDNKMIGGYLLRIRILNSAANPGQKTFVFNVIGNSEDYMRYNLTLKSDNLSVMHPSAFNALNNGHRVLRQYPHMLTNQNLEQAE